MLDLFFAILVLVGVTMAILSLLVIYDFLAWWFRRG